ncbi:MAG: SDR family NAD(P)-dependent oxidoreductase [Pyrinomonadaceae bacterium]
MDLFLKDSVACVAGSSRGIGRAIAQAFLKEGARVVVAGRDKSALAQTERELAEEFGSENVLGCAGDLTEDAHLSTVLAQVIHRWGRIDCVIANVGSGTAPRGWQLTQSDWNAAFDVNLWSGVRLVNAVLPAMIEAQHGSIIFIASIAALESLDAPLPYSTAKTALVSYSKNLSRQVGVHGIRVNCVAPGNILFPGGSWEKKLAERREHFQHYIATEVPLRRFGTPEEIASLVVFLGSRCASFITGACLTVDGGQTRGI